MRLLSGHFLFVFVVLGTQAASANPVVTVTSKTGEVRTFTLEELDGLGVETVKTHTSWTEGVQEFSGPRLSAIAKAMGHDAGSIVVKAVNAYEAEIALAEAQKYPVILATRHNGALMSVRDKGPTWVVYPRADFPELDDESHNHKWVWQVVAIELR